MNKTESFVGQLEIKNHISTSKRFSFLVENLSNLQGSLNPSEYEGSGSSGEIKIDLSPDKDKLMLVKTDTGALVNSKRELVTERLSGCVGLFIQGPDINYLIHLTPSSRIGYYYYRYSNQEELVSRSVQRIIELLAQVVNPENCRGILVVNQGDNNGGHYDSSNVSRAWLKLRKQLLGAGLGEVVICDPLPLDETTLYFSPETPESLFVVGIDISKKDFNTPQTEKAVRVVSIQSGKLIK